jgi:hypothetical protein
MIASSGHDDVARPPTSGVRSIRDETGRWWKVREIVASDYDRRGSRALVFETADIMRRVRHFPPNWRELTDAELYALSLGS